MKTLRMTDRWVRTISVESGREEYCDSVLRGLRLRVSSASVRAIGLYDPQATLERLGAARGVHTQRRAGALMTNRDLKSCQGVQRLS